MAAAIGSRTLPAEQAGIALWLITVTAKSYSLITKFTTSFS